MPQRRPNTPTDANALLGRCADIANLRRTIGLLATVDAPVWIQGETGTGKELVARQLHALSPRATRPFIAVNAATLPDDLAESLLFGHRRGAFSGAYDDHMGFFEAADGGTLFLDEIADLPVSTQAKLLRVLDSGTFYRVGETRERRADVRLITASHRDLTEAVAAGCFREDLLYRVNVIPIALPPLRARGRDVVLLARHFLDQASIRWQRASPTLSPDGERALLRCPWPGNVRELRNVCERAVLLTPSGQPLDHDRVLSFVALGQPPPPGSTPRARKRPGHDIRRTAPSTSGYRLSRFSRWTGSNTSTTCCDRRCNARGTIRAEPPVCSVCRATSSSTACVSMRRPPRVQKRDPTGNRYSGALQQTLFANARHGRQ